MICQREHPQLYNDFEESQSVFDFIVLRRKLPLELISFLLILAANVHTMMAWFSRKKRRLKAKLPWKSKKKDSSPSGNWQPEDDSDEGKIVFFGGSNYTFDLDDLLAASAEILGRSASGSTYKVAVDDTATVVVKRLEEVVVGRREFEQTMEIVGRIKHENVAELKAYYFSKNDKLAVYSYYIKGNLFEMLHGKLSLYIIWSSSKEKKNNNSNQPLQVRTEYC